MLTADKMHTVAGWNDNGSVLLFNTQEGLTLYKNGIRYRTHKELTVFIDHLASRKTS